MITSMISVFKTVLSMSVSSVWIILAVIVLRLVLRRVPKQARVLMWLLPAVRLTVPFSIESRFSVTPEPSTIILSSPAAVWHGTEFDFIVSGVWLTVMTGMLIYMLMSFVSLKLRVHASLRLRDNIYVCDIIGLPFVFGLFRPRIYVPSDMNGRTLDYVLMHEQAHIERLDTLWKPLAFLILSIHWFNPLAWAAYILFTRDTELACDERAIKDLPFSGRKEYSAALLKCCTGNHFTAACPFAFGENPVRRRIKSILGYKKPKLIYKVAAIVLCAIATMLFLTNPVTAKVTRDSGTVVVDPLKNLWHEPPATEPATEAATPAPTEPVDIADEETPEEDHPETEYLSDSEEIYQEPDDYSGYGVEDNNYIEEISDNSGQEPAGFVEPRSYESDPEQFVLEKNWWENPAVYNIRGEIVE